MTLPGGHPGARLRADGTSVLLVPSADGVPTLLHSGADLGELSAHDVTGYAGLRVPVTAPGSTLVEAGVRLPRQRRRRRTS